LDDTLGKLKFVERVRALTIVRTYVRSDLNKPNQSEGYRLMI
jgi:hypothetical protein